MSEKPRKLKWKKAVVIVEQGEITQLCLACGNAFEVISPYPPYAKGRHGFCPFCGSEIVERIELDEGEYIEDWVVEVCE